MQFDQEKQPTARPGKAGRQGSSSTPFPRALRSEPATGPAQRCSKVPSMPSSALVQRRRVRSNEELDHLSMAPQNQTHPLSTAPPCVQDQHPAVATKAGSTGRGTVTLRRQGATTTCLLVERRSDQTQARLGRWRRDLQRWPTFQPLNRHPAAAQGLSCARPAASTMCLGMLSVHQEAQSVSAYVHDTASAHHLTVVSQASPAWSSADASVLLTRLVQLATEERHRHVLPQCSNVPRRKVTNVFAERHAAGGLADENTAAHCVFLAGPRKHNVRPACEVTCKASEGRAGSALTAGRQPGRRLSSALRGTHLGHCSQKGSARSCGATIAGQGESSASR